MSTSTPRPAEKPWQYNIFWMFSMAGMLIIVVGFIIGLTTSSTASGYWSEHTKLERDCNNVDPAFESDFDAVNGLLARGEEEIGLGSSNAQLTDDLKTIASTPKWLEPFIFLGVAVFMVGIALEFSAIPSVLQNRGGVMGAVYSEITKG